MIKIPKIFKTAFLLISVLLLAGFTGSKAQTVDVDVNINPNNPSPGEEFEVTFSTDNANGLFYLGLEVGFDQDNFEFVSVQPGELMDPNPLSVGGELEANRIGVSVVRVAGAAAGSGNVMTLTFKVKDDAVPNSYNLTLSAIDGRNSTGAALATNIEPETIVVDVPEIANIGWVNVQWPNSPSTITLGDDFNVYAQIWIDGVTNNPNPAGVEAWIGFNTVNATEVADFADGWTWVPASFNINVGNNSEYEANIGAQIPEAGTYYYVSRFRYNGGAFAYGGTNGFWNNDSVQLTVNPAGADPDSRPVTFSVDMTVQQALGHFNPDVGDILYVRGAFNNWETSDAMTHDGDGIYEATLAIEGAEGLEQQFKYYVLSGDGRLLPNEGWESLGPDGSDNRSFLLGPVNVAQILPTVFFNDDDELPPPTDSRDVTFSVNMNAQISQGNFDPASDAINIFGSFTGWNSVAMTESAEAGIYEITLEIEGAEGTEGGQYKYRINDQFEGDVGPGDSGNRVLTLGPVGVPQILETVFYNNDDNFAPDSRNVTFSVNMNVQIALGNFDPATDVARVNGSYSGWSASDMTESATAGIYEFTTSINGDEGASIQYKFMINDDYELFGQPDRTFNLGPADVDQVLDTVFYDNNDELPPPTDSRDVTFSVNMNAQISQGNFDPASDAINIFGSFTGWNSVAMTESAEAGIYEITLEIEGAEGTEGGQYKYRINDQFEGDVGPGDNGNRVLTLGPVGVPQILETVFYNNDDNFAPDSRNVTFSVNMNVQIALGNFDPATDVARVNGSFSGWSASDMTESATAGIYEFTTSINGDEGTSIQYKFMINADFELPGQPNRTFNLGPADVDQVLDTVFYDNNDQFPTDPEIQFANLQFPGQATIEQGSTVDVYAQVYIPGVTDQGEDQADGIQAWIGVSTSNTNPTEWDASSWLAASFHGKAGMGDNNEEYMRAIGEGLAPGTYYYASRFQYLDQAFVYGGFNEDGGGFWDGTDNVSGVLTVEVGIETVIVWPGDTNNDGVVNETDVLALGTYFGMTGPARENPSTDWVGQTAVVWDPVAATYADTDGSGLINQTDLLAIGLNFGQVHGGGMLSGSIKSIALPAIGADQYLEIEVRAIGNLQVQGVSVGVRVEGLTESDFMFDNIEAGPWASNWSATNQLIEFERPDALKLGMAYVHKGMIAPVTANGLVAFEMDASTNWPSGANLVIERVVYVDGTGAQIAVEDVEVIVTIQGGVNVENPELPVETALRQNYPNPFNPTTNIQFDLSAPTTVTVEVVNILGQRVAVLANNEDMAAGSYTRVFDAGRLTSGIYLVRMVTPESTFTRKMMLVK